MPSSKLSKLIQCNGLRPYYGEIVLQCVWTQVFQISCVWVSCVWKHNMFESNKCLKLQCLKKTISESRNVWKHCAPQPHSQPVNKFFNHCLDNDWKWQKKRPKVFLAVGSYSHNAGHQWQKSNLHPFATKNKIIRNLMSKISLYVWGLGFGV